ncbi:hypothetical protein AB1Y20_014584 [Prymnesium parvum]|uniref:Radical SAM core domain-containing protein n=1 Tax=Prymnesium parvum TaxID=97485 RepID=A0AB34IDV4_PRYPA
MTARLAALLASLSPAHAISLPNSPTTATSQLPLLVTPPEALRRHFGWPRLTHAAADKGDGVWALLRKGIDPTEEAELRLWSANLHSPRLQRLLQRRCAPLCPASVREQTISADGTQKLLLQLEDGLAVECVLIPMLRGKTTSLCLSSQVGCSHACAFCSTGTMGLLRPLRTEEILAQVWMALRLIRERGLPKLVNIVFMGMGEPLDNFEQVRRAVDILVEPKAFGFSRRCVCVSTVGPSPALISRAVASLPCRLAWSVHAAEDSLRRQLVPTTRHTMEELRDAFVEALAAKPARVQGLVVELALIAGVNDQPMHAEQLAHLLHPFGLGKVLVNLIPYNNNGLGLSNGVLFSSPSAQVVRDFQQRLWAHHFLCTIRETRGDEERSACGQLATNRRGG